MKRNLKKVVRWLKQDLPNRAVNDETHPTNFVKAMQIVQKEKEQV